MDIGSLATSKLITVGPAHCLADAARTMTEHGVGSAVVLCDDGSPGIITERDLMRAVADEVDVRSTTVASYMTPTAITATATWDATDAAKRMLDGGFRHLVVVGDGGRVEGVLSIRDLLNHFIIQGVEAPASSPRA